MGSLNRDWPQIPVYALSSWCSEGLGPVSDQRRGVRIAIQSSRVRNTTQYRA
jgi:hypothetical protein